MSVVGACRQAPGGWRGRGTPQRDSIAGGTKSRALGLTWDGQPLGKCGGRSQGTVVKRGALVKRMLGELGPAPGSLASEPGLVGTVTGSQQRFRGGQGRMAFPEEVQFGPPVADLRPGSPS